MRSYRVICGSSIFTSRFLLVFGSQLEFVLWWCGYCLWFIGKSIQCTVQTWLHFFFKKQQQQKIHTRQSHTPPHTYTHKKNYRCSWQNEKLSWNWNNVQVQMMKSCARMYKYHPRKIHVRNTCVYTTKCIKKRFINQTSIFWSEWGAYFFCLHFSAMFSAREPNICSLN